MNKLKHRKRLLEHEFCLWFDLKRDDNMVYQCCLAMSHLTTKEQERISENIKDIAMQFYQTLQPYLDVEQGQHVVHAKDDE